MVKGMLLVILGVIACWANRRKKYGEILRNDILTVMLVIAVVASVHQLGMNETFKFPPTLKAVEIVLLGLLPMKVMTWIKRR